ncbi:unnamed protein product [Lampetra planeri]
MAAAAAAAGYGAGSRAATCSGVATAVPPPKLKTRSAERCATSPAQSHFTAASSGNCRQKCIIHRAKRELERPGLSLVLEGRQHHQPKTPPPPPGGSSGAVALPARSPAARSTGAERGDDRCRPAALPPCA